MKTAALGIGVPAGEPQPCSGMVFALKSSGGFIWPMRYGNREAAQAKIDHFSRTKAGLIGVGSTTDISLYEVEIIEVPSEEPDAIQSRWGTMKWIGKLSDDGTKLYALEKS